MTIPLARFLVDFSEIGPMPAVVAGIGLGLGAEPADDGVARQLEDTRRQALEEAREDAETTRAAMRAEHDAQLAQERQQWVACEGDRLGAALSGGLVRLEERVAEMVAELLEPLVVEAVRLKAVQDLRDVMAGALANTGDVAVVVTGPDDLTDAIRAGYSGPARFVAGTGSTCDLVIQAGDTQIRTQLEAWTERLRLNLRAQP